MYTANIRFILKKLFYRKIVRHPEKIKFTHIYVQVVLLQHRHLFILYSVTALTWSEDRLGSQQCVLHYNFVNLQSYKTFTAHPSHSCM